MILLFPFFSITNKYSKSFITIYGIVQRWVTFLDLEDGTSDRTEIFTTDTAPKITKQMFEEKNYSESPILPLYDPIRISPTVLKSFL